MKTLRVVGAGQFLILSAVVFLFQARVFAQTIGSGSIPVITIQATQPIASFGANSPGVFTVFRKGDTNLTLNVFYQIGGTASNGVDYAQIPNWVTIPAGATSNAIVITPLTNLPASTVAKTVVLQLAPPPTLQPLNPVNYKIGVPSNAVVYLENKSVTNFPSVNITRPPDGATFFTPTNILITASISYLTPTNFGDFTNLEFFAGDDDLGKGTLEISSGFSGILFLTWTNPPPGNYALRAVASYSGNVSITSAPVNITVSLPVTNFPPAIRIVSPANGAVFHAPVNIPLFAYAAEPNSTDAVASVEFFAGTNSLGFGQPVKPTPIANAPVSDAPIAPVRPISLFDLYSLIWSNAPAGNYELTAVATGDNGISSTSAPVKIAVLPLPPPPTNRPAVVSIVATDPVAVAGTNSWTWPGETNSPPNWNAWPFAVSRFFTNAGPKTATFTVRRAGDTNDDLTVLYDIGGTASNGVDYVALPGFVTVPAGERAALITVVPIDNGSNNISSAVKTVVLTLTPSTNTPPDYQIGFPRRAAAVIVDSRRPRPVSGLLPGGSFHLNASGPDAAWFRVEYSTNLINWTPVCTNQVINGSIDFIDPDAPNSPSRFYRAVPLTNVPSD